ncbi:MAG: OadG family protein [Lachnospiraceae bacterium]|nr:OadG family protein [Lachnospiraceae bacterium]
MILDALRNMVIGMASVFAVLILISLLIYSLNIIPYLKNKFESRKKSTVNVPESTDTPVQEYEDVTNDTELVAVIAAAVMAYGNLNESDFIVRSIKRR